MYQVSWSIPTLILYIVLGLMCFASCFFAKQVERVKGIQRKIFSAEYLPWYLSWIVIAVFRCVNSNVGGTDAPGYIAYFENCLNLTNDNTDIVFRLFNCAIRSITSNYHVYFFIYYVFIIFACALFINNFARKESSSIPLAILFFLFLRSFTSMRSNFAIAIVLVAVVYLSNGKIWKAAILGILAVLTHVTAFVYVSFIFFYFLYKEKKIGLVKSIIFFAIMFGVSIVSQYIVSSGLVSYLAETSTGAYSSYASRRTAWQMFTDFSVVNLPQVALLVFMLIFRKQLDARIDSCNDGEKRKLGIIRIMCYYDFFLVPVITTLSIYRGYEFFYLVRLVMWGELIPIIRRRFSKSSQCIISICFALIFIVWMCGRIEGTYETSHLMPYVFG